LQFKIKRSKTRLGEEKKKKKKKKKIDFFVNWALGASNSPKQNTTSLQAIENFLGSRTD